MNKSFLSALNSLNTNRNVQSETNSAEHQSSFDYTSYHYYIETTFKQSIAKIFDGLTVFVSKLILQFRDTNYEFS